MFTFIHAADIHLDSPLRGLPAYEGAPVEALRRATREALENLVHVALEEQVDFLLIAGDIYDGDWKDHNTGLYFVKQMARLKAGNIPVYLIAGNHDAQSVMTKKLQLPDNVHAFPTNKAGTVHLESLGVAIHGQGFKTRSVTTDLTATYPKAVAGAFNIGLLHTSLTGYEGHDNYAPCTVDGLIHLGYDYWALGHIHQQECVRDESPAIWFPGNIQGRHIREAGPRGCLVVTVDDHDRPHADFRPLDVLRWDTALVDLSGCDNAQDALRTISEHLEQCLESIDEQILALRVVLTGATELHPHLVARPDEMLNEIRAVALSLASDRIYIEKLKLRTTPPEEAEAGPPDNDPRQLVGEVVEALKASEDGEARLRELLDPLRTKLPAELSAREHDLDLADPETLRELLDASSAIIQDTWRDLEERS
jgi:DNA repair exonuclease SbcCD nuclease subunit